MNLNSPVLVKLRDDLQVARDDLKKYVDLYRAERSDRREQESICINLRKQNDDLLQHNQLLREKLDKVMQHIDAFQIPKPYKKWEDLQAGVSKAKRQTQYRKCLEQSMMYLHEAKRVRVQLRIGEKEVFFVWCTNELRMLRNQARNLQALNVINESNSNQNHENIHEYDSEEQYQQQQQHQQQAVIQIPTYQMGLGMLYISEEYYMSWIFSKLVTKLTTN